MLKASLKTSPHIVFSQRDCDIFEFWLLDATSPGHLPWPTDDAGNETCWPADAAEQRWLELYLRLEGDL